MRIKEIPEYFLDTFSLKEFALNEKTLLFVSSLISIYYPKSNPFISIEANLKSINKNTEIEHIIREAFQEFFNEKLTFDKFQEHLLEFQVFLDNYFSTNNLSNTRLLSLNEFMLESLSKIYSPEKIKSIAKSSFYSADVGLRINTLTSSIKEVTEILKKENIEYSLSDLSPVGIILKGRPNLNNSEIYKSGKIEVQDIGSQLISFALNPSKNSTILDACAGAGGKTLHLADITADKASITATDIEYNRLKEISKRAAKAGYSSIDVVIQKKMQLKELIKTKFDYILVDAPCSGTGTIRRMPMTKYRINQKLMDKLSTNQYRILEYYSSFLDTGGELVYATCSLLPQENSKIITRFLENCPEFEPVPLKPAFDANNINISNLSDSDYMLSLNPAEHKTDGFFMAKIRRKDL